MCTCTSTHMCVFMCTFLCVCIRACAPTHVHVCVCAHVCALMCDHVHSRACCACIPVCACIRMCVHLTLGCVYLHFTETVSFVESVSLTVFLSRTRSCLRDSARPCCPVSVSGGASPELRMEAARAATPMPAACPERGHRGHDHGISFISPVCVFFPPRPGAGVRPLPRHQRGHCSLPPSRGRDVKGRLTGGASAPTDPTLRTEIRISRKTKR